MCHLAEAGPRFPEVIFLGVLVRMNHRKSGGRQEGKREVVATSSSLHLTASVTQCPAAAAPCPHILLQLQKPPSPPLTPGPGEHIKHSGI